MEWYLYIIKCNDDSLYTGITTDIKRRFKEHNGNGKKGAKYLRGRKPLTLMFNVEIGSKSDALKVERKVKQLPTIQKKLLTVGKMVILENIIEELK